MKINVPETILYLSIVHDCVYAFEEFTADEHCTECIKRNRSQTCPVIQYKERAMDLIKILEKYTDAIYDAGQKIPLEISEEEFIQLLRKEGDV